MTVSPGSLQLQRYRSARRRGASMMTACVESGIDMAEARLIEADDARNPPPEPPAPPSAQPEDTTMARRKKSDAPRVEEVGKPDFELAVKLYRNDIKPAASKVGEHAQEMSTAYKEIKKRANIQPQAARLAFRLDDMEESKRDDFLRSFNGLLKALNIFMPADLFDAAEGKGALGDAVVPIGERRRPQLATVPTGPEGDTDLIDAADDLQAAE